MMPLLKIASIGGVCAGALGCFWLITHIHGMPPYRDLSTDSDFSTTYTSKYAADYSKYFVGVNDTTTDSQSPAIDNKDWWDWSYQNRYLKKEDIKDKFKNKNRGSDLKEACKEAYKAEANKVTEQATNTDEYKEEEIWIFCSIGGNKPTTISDTEKSSYGTNNFGGKEEYTKLLISVENENNNWFWDVKEKEFFVTNTTYPSDLSDTSSKFKKAHDNKNQYENLTHRKVKELCKEAYSQSDSSTDFPKKVVFKFCSLKGKEPSGGGN